MSQKKNAASEERREWAVQKLRDRANELGRIPRKADFDGSEVMRIKAALGPWHRAQEAAGLKEPKQK